MKYDGLRKKDRNQMVIDAVTQHPDLALAEIGRLFNISPSRVSRISGAMRKGKRKESKDGNKKS